MRTILAALVALTALGSGVPTKADVVVRTDNVPMPYWRGQHEGDWQSRREFREQQFQRDAWLRDHCVRDWTGVEYCRR